MKMNWIELNWIELNWIGIGIGIVRAWGDMVDG